MGIDVRVSGDLSLAPEADKLAILLSPVARPCVGGMGAKDTQRGRADGKSRQSAFEQSEEAVALQASV